MTGNGNDNPVFGSWAVEPPQLNVSALKDRHPPWPMPVLQFFTAKWRNGRNSRDKDQHAGCRPHSNGSGAPLLSCGGAARSFAVRTVSTQSITAHQLVP